MTRRILSILLLPALLSGIAGCVKSQGGNPYDGTLCAVKVQLQYPEGYETFAREGVNVSFEEVNNGYAYCASTASDGSAHLDLPCGLYTVSVSDRSDNSIFNGTLSRLQVSTDVQTQLSLKYSKAGTLVIKEIYCGGCKKLPEVGNYQVDKYIILHNNDSRTTYLDSLCFGTLCPYNSEANNPFGGIRDFAPVIQALWQFGGTGTSFPLAPGEDAVLCIYGAIDHTVQYPLSVNLNRPGYFVTYNNTYFTNTSYHPAPGDNIAADHILDVVVKVGIANAYTLSNSSPTVLIFRPQGTSMREYVKKADSIIQVPGSSVDKVVKVLPEWVMDAVEVFNGASTSNVKRLLPDLDAGSITLSGTYLNHSLCRTGNADFSLAMGYEYLCDTNNSSADFYERLTPSLND